MDSNDNPLQGKWLVESQLLTKDNRWVAYDPFPKGKQNIIWTFHNGKLTESYIHSPELANIIKDRTNVTECFYDTKEQKLYIDRSRYLADGFTDMCENDIFRVVRNSENKLTLNDLEDVQIEPDDYFYRLILTRIR